MTIPYTRETWVDDTTSVTASRLNNLEQGIVDAQQQPAVRVYHNANQSINDNTATALAFNQERFDHVGGAASTQHDISTNNSRLTCRYAGRYLITASINWAADADGYRSMYFRIGGATRIAEVHLPTVGAGLQMSMGLTTVYELAVNDYVEVIVAHTAGAALNVMAAGNYSPEFSMVRVA